MEAVVFHSAGSGRLREEPIVYFRSRGKNRWGAGRTSAIMSVGQDYGHGPSLANDDGNVTEQVWWVSKRRRATRGVFIWTSMGEIGLGEEQKREGGALRCHHWEIWRTCSKVWLLRKYLILIYLFT